MELRQLRYLARIADTGSLGKAAASLRLTQPGLSQQIRKLERELGVSLLTRHPGGVMPTLAGERLVAHARRILEDLERAVQDTLEHADRVTGRVAVGLPAPLSLAFGTRIVRALFERFPGVAFNLVEGRSTQLEEWLLAGELDFALIYQPSATHLLLQERMWDEELVLFGPRASPPLLPPQMEDLRGLAEVPLILSAAGNTTRLAVERAASRAGVSLQVTLEISSLPALLDLVADGFGCSILNDLSILPGLAAGRFETCRLPQPDFSHRLALCWPTGRALSRAARELARLIGPLLRDCYRDAGGCTGLEEVVRA